MPENISEETPETYMHIFRETFREIRRRGWETPVIVCSGFSGDETRSRFGEEQPNGYLQKPFSLISLRDSLQKTLS